MIEYAPILDNLFSELKSDYEILFKTNSSTITDECFKEIFETSWQAKLSETSFGLRKLIDFITVADDIEKLKNTMGLISKYQTAYSIQGLFKHLDSSFIIEESDKYLEAKKEEKKLKYELRQLGVSTDWINKKFNSPNSIIDVNNIPEKDEKESYEHYLRKVLKHAAGDFDIMMKLYLKITPAEDKLTFTKIKFLISVLRENGVSKTSNEIYEYMEMK